ncbi:45779_t:CDS:2 [Gigaspora margarita]|uniref:45779_t:CDS:1 n=1 Tax=Gigaspora margarita TaxID=4874 RepID=A0ABN7V203_GIGMA|nr:45779_t:CDS:2 [Gigaspora margarita]
MLYNEEQSIVNSIQDSAPEYNKLCPGDGKAPWMCNLGPEGGKLFSQTIECCHSYYDMSKLS